MSKKLFVIAAFSVALLASTETFADAWEIGMLRFKDKNDHWESTGIPQYSFGSWESTEDKLLWGMTNLKKALRTLRDDGWELVSVTVSGDYTKMYFKKPK